MDEEKPTIIALSEINVKEDAINQVKLPGYNLVSKFCRKNSNGGGVLIFVDKNIKAKQLFVEKIQELTAEKIFECCIVKVKTDTLTFVLACIYHSPIKQNDDVFLNKLDVLLGILCKINPNVIVTGDFNINVLSQSNALNNFNSILKSHNMQFLVDFPTRVTDKGQSGIDNFVTNLKNNKINVSGLITELSDHDAQILEIKDCPINNVNTKIYTKVVRKLNDENFKTFNFYLSKETWIDVYNACVDKKYEVFNKILLYYFDICFPKCKVRYKENKSCKWCTSTVRQTRSELINISKCLRGNRTNLELKNSLKDKKSFLRT